MPIISHPTATEGSTTMNREPRSQGTLQSQLTALAGWQARALITKLQAGQPLGLGEQRLMRTAQRRAASAAGAARVETRAWA